MVEMNVDVVDMDLVEMKFEMNLVELTLVGMNLNVAEVG